MTNPKSRIFAAVVGALSMGTMAWAAEPTQQDEIQELKAKVAALEARQASNSKDMAATIDAVLRDAEKRSQLLATTGDMGAGYDNGFYIRAGDAWVMRPMVQMQFRNVTNFREDVADKGDDIENGFEMRRLRFDLGGTAFTRDLEYFFEWESDRNGGDLFLLEGWARYMFSDDWGVRAGQFKDLTTHEFLVSSKRQLAADTSLMDALIGGGVTGYTQGVSLVYGGYNKNNPLNVEVAITDGANQINTDFQDHGYDFGVAGRAEWKAFGNWASYRDFTAWGNKEDLLVFGAGGDWSQNGDGDLLVGTVDAQFETANGLSLYGAGVVNWTNSEFNAGTGDQTNWGLLAQAGYMLNPAWEIFGRYDVTFFDNDIVSTDEDTFHEITLGVNYYLGNNGSAGHRAKITVDVSWLPNGSPAPVTGLGILDENGGSNEFMLRAQLQLLI